MRIALWLLQDSVRNWSSWIAGLHYIRNCLEGLASLPANEVPAIVAFVPETLRTRFLDTASFRDAPWLELVSINESLLNNRELRSQLRDKVAQAECDVLFPATTPPIVPFEGSVIGWITDFQHRHYPEFFSSDEIAFRDRLFSFLGATCDRIACSSETVKQDLLRFQPAAGQRGSVLRFRTRPPASAYRTSPESTLRKLGLQAPFAYLPYQFWKHKNHRTVFEAWRQLRAQGRAYPLICTGATEDNRSPDHFRSLAEYLAKNGLTEQVKVLGLVERDVQWQLYRGAKLVLQPSLFEGWSTSVEEACSLGKSVLLSDIPVHREQMQQGGRFFDPLDATALAKLVETQWDALPDGLDSGREEEALQTQPERMQQFGRQLVALFQDAVAEDREAIGLQVLPLYLFMQEQAEARLEVIKHLTESDRPKERRRLKRFFAWQKRN